MKAIANEGCSTLQDKLDHASRMAMAHLPTPLELLKTLADDVPNVNLFIKRDDCTGLAFGGNKARKLEYTVGHALEQGATTLITASSFQSNHVRQTAAAAAQAGLSFHAVVASARDPIPTLHLESGNLLLSGILGAQIHITELDLLDSAAQDLMSELRQSGERPYLIPLGASDGIGSLGYVRCALELLDQCEKDHISPKAIFTATGSGGTHAGLLAGLRLAGSSIPVVGISVSDAADIKCDKIKTCLADIGRILGVRIPVEDEEIVVHDAYVGDGYAHPTDAANHWIKTVARQAGIFLDSVYTGKAFAGMADVLGTKQFNGGGDVIFLHTGGAPVLFAEPSNLWRPRHDAPEIAALVDAAEAQRIRIDKSGRG